MSALGVFLGIGAGMGAFETFATCGNIDFDLVCFGVFIAAGGLVGIAIFLFFFWKVFDRNPQLEIHDDCLIDHRHDSKKIYWQNVDHLSLRRDAEFGFDVLVIRLASDEKIEIDLEGLNFHSVEIFRIARAVHLGSYLAATRLLENKVSFSSLLVRNVLAYTLCFVLMFSLFGLIPLLDTFFYQPQFILASIFWLGKIAIVAGLALGVLFGVFSTLLGKFAPGMAS